MSKEKKSLPKRNRHVTVESPEEKAAKAKQINDRNNTIASYYFQGVPSFQNLVKGAYYWSKGNLFGDSEDPEDYRTLTGTPPTVGGPLKPFSVGGAKILREIVGKRPQVVEKAVSNGIRAFQRGVTHGMKVGRREGASEAINAMSNRVSRAYKLGTERGSRAAERAAKKAAKEAAKEKYREGWLSGRKKGADIQRRWSARSATSNTPTPSTPSTPESSNLGFWGNTRRTLWETSSNNFGNSYRWRNVGRVPAYLFGAPYVTGIATGTAPRYFEYLGKSFAKGYKTGVGSENQNDSIKADTSQVILQNNPATNLVDTVVPIQRNNIGPVTTSTDQELDSINNAWFGE